MKSIVFVTRVLRAGGAEKVLTLLADKFLAKGIKCTIITTEDASTDYEFSGDIRIENIGKIAGNALKSKYFQYKRVRAIVKEIKPDIVLSLPEDIGIYVIGSMIGTGIPVVVSERNNPWVMPDKKISRILRKLWYPYAKGIIFQTEQAASFFSKKIRKKGIILSNPLETDKLPLPYEGVREKIVVGAGRLDKQKNFPVLIDAFKIFHSSHPDYKLVIYGEGRERKSLEEYANLNLKKGSFELPGRVSNLPNIINSAEMFVLSSDYEGMPNVLIEAMAMGVPCISTGCPSGGPKELISNGENGYLVPVGDSESIAAAMAKISDIPSLQKEFSEKAVVLRERLNAENVCMLWLEYLDSCVKK